MSFSKNKSVIMLTCAVVLVGAVIFVLWSKEEMVDPEHSTYDVYETQERCEQESGEKCLSGSCESNCGPSGGWKGWYSVKDGFPN